MTAEWFLSQEIDDLDGNGLLKTYALSMEDTMAVGTLGIMGETSPLNDRFKTTYGIKAECTLKQQQQQQQQQIWVKE